MVSPKFRFLVLYCLFCTPPLSVLLFHHSPWTITCTLTTHNYSSLSIHPFSTPASLSFSILSNRYIPRWLLIFLTLNSSKTVFLFIGLLQQLSKINTSSLCLQPWFYLWWTPHFLWPNIRSLSLRVAIIIFVNFGVYVLILTSKLLVPSPLLLFSLNLTTATPCIIIFHRLKEKYSRTSRTLLVVLSPERQNLLTSLLFLNLYNGSK